MADTEPRPRLTTKLVAPTPAPASGAIMLWDCDLRGFGVRISAGDVRTFFLNYRSKADGREGRITIGRFPTWTAEAARKEAEGLRKRIDKFEDPVAQRRERRAKPTMADLAQRYSEKHMPHKTGLA